MPENKIQINFDWKAIIVLLFAIVIVFYLVKINNNSNEQLQQINNKLEQNKAETERLRLEFNNAIEHSKFLNNYYDSLYRLNTTTIKRFSYELQKIDELFKNNPDSMFVNSVLRYWTNRLYGLPEFFQRPIDNNGITIDSENITTGRKLLSSE